MPSLKCKFDLTDIAQLNMLTEARDIAWVSLQEAEAAMKDKNIEYAQEVIEVFFWMYPSPIIGVR